MQETLRHDNGELLLCKNKFIFYFRTSQLFGLFNVSIGVRTILGLMYKDSMQFPNRNMKDSLHDSRPQKYAEFGDFSLLFVQPEGKEIFNPFPLSLNLLFGDLPRYRCRCRRGCCKVAYILLSFIS